MNAAINVEGRTAQFTPAQQVAALPVVLPVTSTGAGEPRVVAGQVVADVFVSAPATQTRRLGTRVRA